MGYRPICDTWILARPKVPFYGAYPNGFLERALPMIGCNASSSVLHLCGGSAKKYPNKRLVKNAFTVDVDPRHEPDAVADFSGDETPEQMVGMSFDGVIVDPPYTQQDHDEYLVRGMPAVKLPNPNTLLRLALMHVEVGGRVGMLHYLWPRPPKRKLPGAAEATDTARSIALISVVCGFGNRLRGFSVYERTA